MLCTVVAVSWKSAVACNQNGEYLKKCSCRKTYTVNFLLNFNVVMSTRTWDLYLMFYSAESVTLNDCLQLSFLPSKRNYMLLLYPREILILDLEVNQTVGVIAIERTGVPFLQVRKMPPLPVVAAVHEDPLIVVVLMCSSSSGEMSSEPSFVEFSFLKSAADPLHFVVLQQLPVWKQRCGKRALRSLVVKLRLHLLIPVLCSTAIN